MRHATSRAHSTCVLRGSWAAASLLALVGLVGTACGRKGSSDAPLVGATPPRGSTAASSPPSGLTAQAAASGQSRIAALRAAENRRAPALVTEADVTSRSPETRRAAALALARIGAEDARAPLLRLLSDDDEPTATFAAYGLGWSCPGHDDEHARALVARAATLELAPPPGGAPELVRSIARALGRCATTEAELTLTAWLKGPRPRAAAAALALGDLAARRRPREETFVALLQAAAGGPGAPPLPEALFAFGRVDPPSRAVAERLRAVAVARLADRGETRVLAIRALGRADDDAAGPLGEILASPDRHPSLERAEAARALARLGDRGQAELAAALDSLVPATDPLSLAGLVTDAMGPRTAALEGLASPPPRAARAALARLAALPFPSGNTPPASITRRLVRLRCLAARTLAAPGATDTPSLRACDPDDKGDEGALARLWVLSKKPIATAKKRAALREFVTSPSARVRTAAYEVLATHREVDDAPALVEEGLRSPHPGTVAAAAEVLVARPDVADRQGAHDVRAALLAALDRALAPDDVETLARLAQAAGATHLAAAKPRLERLCHGHAPTLRASAQAALSLLGDREARCPAVPSPSAAPELDAVLASHPRVVLDTDAGELTLELSPDLAPTATARLLDLARSGFYDDMAIHRVVPGFVVQFGDRAGDGTGGAGRAPLRCETSPLPFEPLSVGVALAGRDTGSSQFFVTLSRTPHLDGEYPLVGRASGDWAAIVEGDRIRKARVVP